MKIVMADNRPLLASFVCCPNVDHVMVPLRIISFKFKQILVKMNE